MVLPPAVLLLQAQVVLVQQLSPLPQEQALAVGSVLLLLVVVLLVVVEEVVLPRGRPSGLPSLCRSRGEAVERAPVTAPLLSTASALGWWWWW